MLAEEKPRWNIEAPHNGLLYLPTQKRNDNNKEIIWLAPAGSHICRGFKGHDLITCESKVQVVVSLWSFQVFFSPGS